VAADDRRVQDHPDGPKKTRGLSRATPAAVQAQLSAQAPLPAPVGEFQRRVLRHFEHEAAKLSAGATWLASSDIIESVFGHHKDFIDIMF